MASPYLLITEVDETEIICSITVYCDRPVGQAQAYIDGPVCIVFEEGDGCDGE